MTSKEFSELTGKNINADNFNDEFEFAHRIYMAAGDIDKQTFCKDYRKSGITPTLCALTDRVQNQADLIDAMTCNMRKAAYALIDTVLTIEDIAIADSVYAQAVKVIGREACIKYKLEKGYGNLTAKDREFLLGVIG